jgi:hypothetical protein
MKLPFASYILLSWLMFCLSGISPYGSGAQETHVLQPTSMTLSFVSASPENSPIQITQVLNDGVPVFFDKSTPLTNGLKDLVIVAKNVSTKNIVHARISVAFPDTGDGTRERPITGYSVTVGRLPSTTFFNRDGTPIAHLTETAPAVMIPPGGELRFEFANVENRLPEARTLLEVTNLAIRLDFGSVYFEDESKWFRGLCFVPGPSPGAWERTNPPCVFRASH